MGLTESSLNTIIKPSSFLSHCKVNCDSPCCQSLCGNENNHCNCSIDTTDDTSSEEGDNMSNKAHMGDSPRTLTPR